jgi:hypothetical protein
VALPIRAAVCNTLIQRRNYGISACPNNAREFPMHGAVNSLLHDSAHGAPASSSALRSGSSPHANDRCNRSADAPRSAVVARCDRQRARSACYSAVLAGSGAGPGGARCGAGEAPAGTLRASHELRSG